MRNDMVKEFENIKAVRSLRLPVIPSQRLV